jgi:hypothetical protein
MIIHIYDNSIHPHADYAGLSGTYNEIRGVSWLRHGDGGGGFVAEEDFRPGQQVRIRRTADSEFAGYRGTIVYVGESVCDVKIVYRPKGSRRRMIHIGTFAKTDLESLRRSFDLAGYAQEPARAHNRRWWPLILLAIIAIAWGVTASWGHLR